MYKGSQKFLIQEADKLIKLGYSVGLSKGKVITNLYPDSNSIGKDWDSISLITDKIMCVDFDSMIMDVDNQPLPPTLEEKSPRGVHLFYRLPYNFKAKSVIKYKPDIDLLAKTPRLNLKKNIKYGIDSDGKDLFWGDHVLISPTNGYSRIYPEETPNVNELTLAPDWILNLIKN